MIGENLFSIWNFFICHFLLFPYIASQTEVFISLSKKSLQSPIFDHLIILFLSFDFQLKYSFLLQINYIKVIVATVFTSISNFLPRNILIAPLLPSHLISIRFVISYFRLYEIICLSLIHSSFTQMQILMFP